MADYRILYALTTDDVVLGELPVTDFTFSEALNAAGTFTATLALDTVQAPALSASVASPELTAATFAPDGRTQIFVERDGVIEWAGILWAYQASIAAQTAVISATGYLSYFSRRLITADATYAAVEQTAIGWGLINTAQTASSIGIIDGSTASGTTRTRTYEGRYALSVGEALRNLSKTDGGFDFRFSAAWSAGSIVKSFTTSFPQTGVATNTVIDTASNVADMRVSVNGTAVNTLAYASGAPGSVRQSTSNAGLEASLPRLEVIEAYPSSITSANLLEHSDRLSQRGSLAVNAISVEMEAGADPAVGGFNVGDIVEVRGSVGWLDTAGDYRIVSYSASVDDSGTEKLQLQLASAEAF